VSSNLINIVGGCFGDYPYYYYYPEFNDIDIITFGLISILLVVVFFYKKSTSKNDQDLDNVYRESLDLLMQPKKEMLTNADEIPFSQFSSKTVYYILGTLILLISFLT